MKRRSFRSPDSGISPAAGVAGAALAFVIIVLGVVRFAFPDAFFAAAAPLWNAGTAAGNAFGFLVSGGDAATLARELAVARADSAAANLEIARLTAENGNLHALMGEGRPEITGTSAPVLSRPPFSAYDTLVVGEGSDGGIALEQVVQAQGGIPIGTIASVSRNTAQVSLYSLPGRAIPAWAGRAHSPITLVGTGSGTYDATAPKDAPVAVGDAVYAPGGTPFARIVRVDENPSSPTKTLHVQSLVNANQLTLVFVVR